MRSLVLTTILMSLLSLPQSGAAQEFVGFDRNSFGQVVLDRKQFAIMDRQDGSSTGLTQPGEGTSESIGSYSPENFFAKLGRPVGRLDILTDNGVFPCTAFIVDDEHIVTNYHCIPGAAGADRTGATRIEAALFWAGYTRQGVEEGARSYTVLPTPVEADEKLDYSVLKVIGDPSEDYGTLELAANIPHDGDPYWVIGHPMGEAQRISREKCQANSPAVSGGRLLHTCDTLPGNSGSPLIDASSRMVIGLHNAGSGQDAVNFATPMQAILEHSRILKAAVGGVPGGGSGGGGGRETGGTVPQPSFCDTLYNKAETLNACYAYDAYLQSCGDHPFAILAKGYVARECSTTPPSGGSTGGGSTVGSGGGTTTELLRPWCSSSRLNPTEAMICGDRYLAGLDAELDRAYANPVRSVSASSQGAWRTGTRDRCGTDTSCISRAVIDRIAYLKTPATSSGSSSGVATTRSGNYELSSSCYIMTASRPSLSEAKAFISQWFGSGQGIRIFRSTNGYYGIALETVSRSSADGRIAQLISAGRIPSDSYCSTGSRFVEEVLWNGGSSGGGTSSGGGGYTMYIDNTASLNVRSGPGTQYGRITAVDRGTQVTVTGSSDGWSNIHLPNGLSGWVSATYLSSSRPSAQRQCYATVTNLSPYSSRTRSDGSGYLNVRSAPSTRGNILTEVYLGDTVQVVAQSNGWAQIRCVSGQCQQPYMGNGGATGWASAKYLAVRCN